MHLYTLTADNVWLTGVEHRDAFASKNTEEYKIEGRIFKESSKTEKESTKPDAEEAIEDCDPIYDKKKKIYYSMTTEKRGTQRTRSTTKTSYKKKVTMWLLQSYKPNCSPLQVHKESAQKSTTLMFEQTNVTYVAFLQPQLVISITTNWESTKSCFLTAHCGSSQIYTKTYCFPTFRKSMKTLVQTKDFFANCVRPSFTLSVIWGPMRKQDMEKR